MKKIINLRLVSGVEVQEILHYVQYSTEIPVEFHFSDYEIPEGASARFYLLKPSGKEIYNECQIDGNTVILQPTAQTFAEYGRQSAQIQIVADDKVLVSYIIRCDIEKNLIAESAIPSADEFGILDTLVEEARKKIKESADATDAAKTATEAANTATEETTAAKEAAETATQEATAATNAANTAADEANTAKAAADTATTAANAATESANTAAQAATEAAERVEEMIESGRGLVPEGGEKDQVLTSDETGAAKWTGDLNVKILKVAGIDMTITEAEYNELMNLLGGGIARICDWLHPVGEVIISADAKFDPNRLYVGQTWERYAKGQTLVGVDEADADFKTAAKTGGSKNAVVVSHTHTQNAHTHTQNAHTHTQNAHNHTQNQHWHTPSDATCSFLAHPSAGDGLVRRNAGSGTAVANVITAPEAIQRIGHTSYTTATNNSATATNNNATATNNSATATNNNTGVDGTGKNMPPYVTTYFWKRTA